MILSNEGADWPMFLGATSSLQADTKGGERIIPESYQSEAAMSVLPAKPIAWLKFVPANVMDMRKSKHALLNRLEEFGALADIGTVDIRRYWKVEPTADAAVIARYSGSDGKDEGGLPALIERRIGQGRVLMMTTGVDGVVWSRPAGG